MRRIDEVVGLDACAVRKVDPRRVAAVQSRLLSIGEAAALSQLFRLLGDITRARLLFALLEGGELCVCDLAATVEVPETSVSHALRLLRTSGVVRARRDGRVIYYSLADAHVRLLLDLSREHLRHGEQESPSGRAGTKRSRRSKPGAQSGKLVGARHRGKPASRKR